jgi:hypothetical protein
MWTFSGKLEVQPWTANDGYYLCMAREAFYTAAGPRDAWPCCITFISVHWQIAELMSADTAHAVRIPSSCPGLSSLVQRVNRQIKSGAALFIPPYLFHSPGPFLLPSLPLFLPPFLLPSLPSLSFLSPLPSFYFLPGLPLRVSLHPSPSLSFSTIMIVLQSDIAPFQAIRELRLLSRL